MSLNSSFTFLYSSVSLLLLSRLVKYVGKVNGILYLGSLFCVNVSSLFLSNFFDILSYISAFLYPLSTFLFFALNVVVRLMEYCVLKTPGVLIFCEDELGNLFFFFFLNNKVESSPVEDFFTVVSKKLTLLLE